MQQLFKVMINNEDITQNINTFEISQEIGRFYNIATLEYKSKIDLHLIGNNIVITAQDVSFSGFIYDVERIDYETFTLICRTKGAYLTEPFCPKTIVTEEQTTAVDLCAYYSSVIGYPISYQSENFDFGGGYERNGTMIDALMNIASITGSEYWDDGTQIIIAPNKAVDEDYFNFVDYGISYDNSSIGKITIQNREPYENSNNIKNRIIAEVDEETGDCFVYTIPSGLIEKSSGVSLDSAIKTKAYIEEISGANATAFDLTAAISSIIKVTVNGIERTDYSFSNGYNRIVFSRKAEGTLKIEYKAFCQQGSVITTPTPIGDFYAAEMYYKDQYLNIQGFIEKKANPILGTNFKVITEGELNPEKGFSVFVWGGNPRPQLYIGGSNYPINTRGANVSHISSEELSLSPVGDGTYEAQTRLKADSFENATSFGRDISFTTRTDGDNTYFIFERYFPKTIGTYKTDMVQFFIKIPNVEPDIGYLTITNLDDGEVVGFDLTMSDETDLDSIPCKLNQNIKVNIASETGESYDIVSGKLLSILQPDETTITTYVRSDGFLPIWIFMNGRYTIYTSPITGRNSTTTLIVNVPNT